MTDIRIANNSQVTLHFAIKLDNGDVVDSTFDKAPATFKVGDGNLLPGFEQALFGLKGGDQRSLPIAPEQGFGQPNPQNVQVMPRSNFEGMELSEGLLIIFNDAAALDRFITTGFDASAQADLAAKSAEDGKVVVSEAANADFQKVKMYQLTEQGLAAQATMQGYKYWPDDELNGTR